MNRFDLRNFIKYGYIKKQIKESIKELYKVCECGYNNIPEKKYCEDCGKNISQIIVSEVEVENNETNHK